MKYSFDGMKNSFDGMNLSGLGTGTEKTREISGIGTRNRESRTTLIATCQLCNSGVEKDDITIRGMGDGGRLN